MEILNDETQPAKETSLYFSLPIHPASMQQIQDIDSLISSNRSDGIEFTRSTKNNSSFFPRINILRLKDFDKTKIADLRKLWKDRKSKFREEISLMITGFTKTEKGLLMMNFESNAALDELLTQTVSDLQEFRTNSITETFGDKHYSKDLHLTMAFGLAENDMDKIIEELNNSGFIGTSINFQSPMIYTRRPDSSWAEETEIIQI